MWNFREAKASNKEPPSHLGEPMPKRLLALCCFVLAATPGFAQAAPLSTAVRTVIDSAKAQTRVTTGYDPSYVRIGYPGGDVKPETGVCADVIIRAFRKAGVDLQKDVHEDMARKFTAYPQRWGLKRPDTNIDHRRVPNLMTFFRRAGKELPITAQAGDYLPGDVVAWDLGGGITHIGIVSEEREARSGRHWMVHNIGRGARLEDVLFSWKVIGHYRYFR
ncbi:MAG TPA: DUF1287 domain-containing protein [Thermoanaerobaculia bacterium]|nr:DUF1287 domain-containing protein [Thermoanaerobaculia bacterium]